MISLRTRAWSPLYSLFVGVAAVSTAGLIAHRALAEASPLAVAAWRLGIASTFFVTIEFVPCARKSETRPALTAREIARLVAGGFCLALHFLTWFISLLYIPVAISTLLACSTPFWSAIIGALFFGRKPGQRFWIGLVIAFAGLLLLVGRIDQHSSPSTLIGDILAGLAGGFVAVYFYCVEGLQHHTSSRLVAWTYSSAALFLWGTLLLVHGVSIRYSAAVWEALVLLAVVPQMIGHTLLNNALRHFPSHKVSLSIIAEPVITAVLAAVLIHEILRPAQIAGGIIVLVALALVLSGDETGAMAAGSMEL